MLLWITIIFSCQLIGEAIVAFFGLPMPGPVAGMVILLVGLIIKGSVPDDLGTVADTLLKNLSLLFVPAGTGIIVHLGLLEADLLSISATLIISTIAAVLVTGFIAQTLMNVSEKREPADD
ncbi:MAG: CidA/LrgA family protein [Pseudomonadota bacterium]